MPLQIHDRLGPYEILARVGEGGMGEVYRARDTRLGRDVAIKTSRAKFDDRFEREARAVAALNHPSICQLYDVGPDYLVLEYIDGAPIAAPGGIRKLLDLAVQLANGIATAHAAGVLHRDLKPSNVLVTTEGRVKILDFGLAKPMTQDLSGTPTIDITAPGIVSGTPAYMSPEQAAGQAQIDARSDQFALGLILYEMAAERHPFKRPTSVETMAAIVRDDPDPLPQSIPAPLRWIIQRCLSKEPRDRYESSRDLYLELKTLRDHLADASSTVTSVEAAPPPRRAHRTLAAAVGAFVAGALLTAGVTGLWKPVKATAPNTVTLKPFSFESGGQNNPVWSPDGKAVAFSARQKETDPGQVYVRYLDSPVATQLTHQQINAVPIAWTSTGRIVFAGDNQLLSISPAGGAPEPFDKTTARAAAVSIAHDGSAVASFYRGDDGTNTIWVSAPPGSPPKRYEPAPFASRTVYNSPTVKFSPDGKQILLFRNSENKGEDAFLLPYPPSASDPPRRVLENLPAFAGTPQADWLPDSRHVVVSGNPQSGINQLYLADVGSGEFTVLSAGTVSRVQPAVSPDGTKLVFVEAVRDFDVISVDRATGAIMPLISTQRAEEQASWAARDASMVYVTDRSGEPEIWLHKPDQVDRPVAAAKDFPPGTTQWFMGPIPAPDGGRLIYTRIERNSGGANLWMAAIAGGAPVRVTNTTGTSTEYAGSWSPDGVWFAYYHVEDGKDSLRKVKTSGQAQPEVLKAGIRRSGQPSVPVWSPTGDWILYNDQGLKLISPDGKNSRDLSSLKNALCTFSRDGSGLICLRFEQGQNGPSQLLTANLEGRAEHAIGTLGREHRPSNSLTPSMRLTLTPDGKSVTYSTVKTTSNIWLMEGLNGVKN